MARSGLVFPDPSATTLPLQQVDIDPGEGSMACIRISSSDGAKAEQMLWSTLASAQDGELCGAAIPLSAAQKALLGEAQLEGARRETQVA